MLVVLFVLKGLCHEREDVVDEDNQKCIQSSSVLLIIISDSLGPPKNGKRNRDEDELNENIECKPPITSLDVVFPVDFVILMVEFLIASELWSDVLLRSDIIEGTEF